MKVSSKVATLSLMMSAVLTGGSAKEDLQVKIINETNVVMVQFFGTHSDAGGGMDLLAGDPLPPGEAMVVDFDDGSGECLFDFRAIFADGVEMVRRRFDVCETSFYRYTSAG
jgi:hypothetical protein